MASRESVRKWFHKFSKIFSVEKRFRDSVAVDKTVVKIHGLRAYVWSAVDVDTGNIRLTGQKHADRYEVP